MKITQSTYMNDMSSTLTIEFDSTPDAKTLFDVLHAVGGAEVKVIEGGKDSIEWGEGVDSKEVQLENQKSIVFSPDLSTWRKSAEVGVTPVYCRVKGYLGETSVGLSLDNLEELGHTILSLHRHLTTLKESV